MYQFLFAFLSCFFSLLSVSEANFNGKNTNLYCFSLPLFNEQGTKICTIHGQQADLFDDKIFKCSNISIRTFSQDKKSLPQIFVISDQAKVNIQENSVSGDGFIAITNGEFSATGQKWKFLGNRKIFTLDENVQVFFEKTQL